MTFDANQTYTLMAGAPSLGYAQGNSAGAGAAATQAKDSWIAIGNVTSATNGGAKFGCLLYSRR
jgi:hypothetical protein